MIVRFVPVSYTHLDVYKRQDRDNIDLTVIRIPQIRNGSIRSDSHVCRTSQKYLSQFHMEHKIITFATSSATVELAAIAAGTEPARIAKKLSFICLLYTSRCV